MEEPKYAWTLAYRYNREQLKELPLVQKLLPLTDKSTKKLDLKNLQATIDKRDFDLELEYRSIYQSIRLINDNARQLENSEDQQVSSIKIQLFKMVGESIQRFRDENVLRFDEMNSLYEKLESEIERLVQGTPYLVTRNKELESISDDESDYLSDEDEEAQRRETSYFVTTGDLHMRVEEIDKRLKTMGGEKGKWLESDHKEFVKIYTRFKGNEERTVKGCLDILGMNNIEIIEHLEHYYKYLELDNQKKVLAAEFKRNKEEKIMLERQRKYAEERRLKELYLKQRADKAAERERQKQQVKEFKERKMSEERKVDEEKLSKLKQYADAKEAKRAASVARTKKKLEEHLNFKAAEEKKLQELQELIKTKTYTKFKKTPNQPPLTVPKPPPARPKK